MEDGVVVSPYYRPSWSQVGVVLADIALDAAKPGMILAAPAADTRGNVLVGAGKPLTPALIDRLKERGITLVNVQTVADRKASLAPNATADGKTAQNLEKFDKMFAQVPQDDLLRAVAAAARSVIAARKG